MLHWVPATLRGEADAARNYDTSSNNVYRNNCMSMQPPTTDPATTNFSVCTGTRDPNGVDFWWDEEEGQDCDPNQAGCVDTDTVNGNCWTGNSGPGGMFTSDPVSLLLPACPGTDMFRPGNSAKQAFLVPCATWDPMTNPDPPRLRLVHGADRAHLIRRFAGPLLVVAAALLMLGGCGDDDDGGPQLAWGAPPRVLTPPDLEGDRVLRGVIRNDTGKTLALPLATCACWPATASACRALRPSSPATPTASTRRRASHANPGVRARAAWRRSGDRARPAGGGDRLVAAAQQGGSRRVHRLRSRKDRGTPRGLSEPAPLEIGQLATEPPYNLLSRQRRGDTKC